ncbi:MAG: pirin family protein [Thermoleophilia bacterium]
MSRKRRVAAVLESRPTLEDAGVRLRRAFGNAEAPRFDPFLMLDDFRGESPDDYRKGFPWHPHRGIETITYMVEGSCTHGDSMGNGGVIGPGDIQWMTAGSGIIHQEMPAGNETGRMGGFQLWANLPAADKMMDARYQGVEACDIPTVQDGTASIRVVAGRVGDTEGPVRGVVIDPEYLDVTLEGAEPWRHPTTSGHTVFAYAVSGDTIFGDGQSSPTSGDSGDADPHDADPGDADPANETPDASRLVPALSTALFTDGDEVVARAAGGRSRFLLVSGRPLHEPVAWYGPIVMNTDEELREAFREYQDGTFVRHPLKGGVGE